MNNARTPRRRTGRALGHLLVAGALCVALTACGSDDDASSSENRSGADPTTSESTSESPSESPGETPSEPPAESPSETPDGEPSGAVEPTPSKDSEGKSDLKVGTVSARNLTALTASGGADGTETRSGKLIIAERGCLHLTTRKGPPTLLVFPAKADLDAARKPTLVLAGKRYPVGTRLDLTGETIQLAPAQADKAAPCVARGEVFRISKIG